MVSYKELGLVNTREMFAKAINGGYAIPAFNFNNMEQLQAIVSAAAETKSPVILQVSKGARNYANGTLLRYMAQGAVEYAKELGWENPQIVLHLDHGDSFETCKSCIDAGFSSVMIDGSHLDYDDNVALTKKVVEYAHQFDVTVEGELGVLAGVEDEVSSDHHTYTKPEEVVDFVTKTGCDSLAISIGTVTVQILKPTDARQYTDTVGMDCRFEAEWLKNTGLFTGERINGENCFFPEKTVSRGDFLAMTVKMLNIPAQTNYEEIPENVPQWLKPYVGAAMRSGLMDGLPETDTLDMPITGAEAAVILQNALDLTLQTGGEADQELPVWAADSIAVMSQHGVELSSESPMTRAQAAEVLYQAKLLSFNAPGMAVFHLQ